MVDVGLAGDLESPVPAISHVSLRSMLPARDPAGRAVGTGRSALDLVVARWQAGEEPAVSRFTSHLP